MVLYQQRLVSVFNAAIAEGVITVNPFDLIQRDERIAKVHPNKDKLCVDEVEAIARVVPKRESEAEIQRAFLFACFTGLRISDIRDLKWSDIKELDGYKAIIKPQVKTGNLVTVPLCQRAVEYLPVKGNDDKVFHLLSQQGLRLGLMRLIKASGVKKSVTFHTSRRTFATLSLASGGELTTVSRLLGHTCIATTEIYTDVLMDSKIRAIQGISDLFKQKP